MCGGKGGSGEESSCNENTAEHGGPSSGRAASDNEVRNLSCARELGAYKDGIYLVFLSWLEIQSRPSYRPSPLVAQVGCAGSRETDTTTARARGV